MKFARPICGIINWARSKNFRTELVVAAGFFCAGFSVLAHAAPTAWLRIEADGFVVYSDASPKEMIEFTVDFAAYRQLLLERFASHGHLPPPTTLILFRRAGEFEAHIPTSSDPNLTLTTYSFDVDGASTLALALDGNRAQALATTFEFDTVWVLRRLGYYVPIWMAQGAGKVFSNLDVRKGKCFIGSFNGTLAGPFYRESNLIDWPHFFEISEDATEYRENPVYHSQAWALMHWILLQEGNARERFDRLALKLRNTPPLTAVAEVMGESPDHLTRAVRRHLIDFKNPVEISFDDAKLRAALAAKPAADADVAVEMATLFEAAGRLPECRRELARAQQLAPELPCVKEALARRALHEDREDEGVRLYREAIAAGSVNFNAYLCSARARLDATSVGGTDYEGSGGRGIDPAIEEIHHALTLNPGDAEAYRLLGRAFFVRKEISEAQVRELDEGASNGEAGEEVRRYVALLWQRLGRLDESIAALQQIVADPDTGVASRRLAQREISIQVFNRDVKTVEGLVDQKNFDAALQLIERAEAKMEDKDLAERYRQVRQEIEKHAK